MTTGDQTRLYQASTSGVATEQNNYDAYGRISDYSLTLSARSSFPMTSSYSYDSANRVTQVTYAAQYGISGTPRKAIAPGYDTASRLNSMLVDGVSQLSDITYNEASQVTSLTTGITAPGHTRFLETYGYEPQTGLLSFQWLNQIDRSGTGVDNSTGLMDHSYFYNRGGSSGTLSGKTGQLTLMTDNIGEDKDRAYEFDALGRLKSSKGGLAADPTTGVTADWTESYSYDRYGNKTGVTASGNDVNGNAPPTDGLASVGYNSYTNRVSDSGWIYDNSGNLVRGQDQGGVWQRFEYDAAGRLVKIKDDSSAVIETVHVVND
jgi:YD repeat-containing protein